MFGTKQSERGDDYIRNVERLRAKFATAALIAMAYDTRFALVLIGSSGEGGSILRKRGKHSPSNIGFISLGGPGSNSTALPAWVRN